MEFGKSVKFLIRTESFTEVGPKTVWILIYSQKRIAKGYITVNFKMGNQTYGIRFWHTVRKRENILHADAIFI